MARFTKVWLIAAVAAVGACNKDGGGKAGGGAAGGAVAILPDSSQYVFGINVAAIRQSGLWKQYGPEITSKLSAEPKYAKAISDCGFDPIQTINSITVGAKSLDDKADTVIVVEGLDKAKVLACADKMKAEVAQDGTDMSHDADTITVKAKDGETTVIGFSGNTLVADAGPGATKDAVAALIKGDHSLAKSAAFTALLGKVHTSDALWAVINGDVPMLSSNTPLGKPQALYGSVQVTDGIAVDGHIKAATADAAKAFVDMMTQQSAKAKMFVDKLDITNAADEVTIAIVVGAEKLKSLKAMAGGLIPGM